jgi:hypothetical protein
LIDEFKIAVLGFFGFQGFTFLIAARVALKNAIGQAVCLGETCQC